MTADMREARETLIRLQQEASLLRALFVCPAALVGKVGAEEFIGMANWLARFADGLNDAIEAIDELLPTATDWRAGEEGAP